MSSHEYPRTNPSDTESRDVAVFLYPSGETSPDEEVKAILEDNPNINVVVVPEGRLLKDWFLLPMAEDSSGYRHFGVEAVRRCLEENSCWNVSSED